MKVDFYQDDFNDIWLMQCDKVMLRKGRAVPTDKGTQIADYVLKKMNDLQNRETSPQVVNTKLTDTDRFSLMRRSQSVLADDCQESPSQLLQLRGTQGRSPGNWEARQ